MIQQEFCKHCGVELTDYGECNYFDCPVLIEEITEEKYENS